MHQLEEYPVIQRVQKYLSQRISTLDVDTLHELHYQMITFGKVFCTKEKPNCGSCPLKEDCKHYASKFGSKLIMQEDMEDMFHDPKVPPVIKEGELLSKAWNYMSEKNIPLNQNAVSQALIAVSSGEASSSISTRRFAERFRTEHKVYELPDSHPLVQTMVKRDPDDGLPYLLAIWPLGETLNALVKEKEKCHPLISSDSREEGEEMVFGTLLVPCRTATRGSFPLDGTFFQTNEVFADDESSRNPLVLPTKSLIDLKTKTLLCGTTITAIFKGMSRQKIKDCFCKGYICIRGFSMTTRAPRPLHQQFHPTLSKVVKDQRGSKITKTIKL
uniref:protein ROS1A-like n=1 Tax=Erigeron canadensis TaxID=72917 RepID=UPI001CB958A7|nr:protein ROS1A-like [Erigeron canadensis]